jgi:hypothetical protein
MLGEKKKSANRTKLRLLLTDAEFRKVGQALEEIRPMNKSFLITEAVQAGLAETNLDINQLRRICEIQFWLPREIAGSVRRLAGLTQTTQRELIHYFLFQYLANSPWKSASSGNSESAREARSRRLK